MKKHFMLLFFPYVHYIEILGILIEHHFFLFHCKALNSQDYLEGGQATPGPGGLLVGTSVSPSPPPPPNQ